MSTQLVLEGFGRCRCWVRRNEDGLILAAYSCPDCISRALDFLVMMSEFDSDVSVSALGEGEDVL